MQLPGVGVCTLGHGALAGRFRDVEDRVAARALNKSEGIGPYAQCRTDSAATSRAQCRRHGTSTRVG